MHLRSAFCLFVRVSSVDVSSPPCNSWECCTHDSAPSQVTGVGVPTVALVLQRQLCGRRPSGNFVEPKRFSLPKGSSWMIPGSEMTSSAVYISSARTMGWLAHTIHRGSRYRSSLELGIRHTCTTTFKHSHAHVCT